MTVIGLVLLAAVIVLAAALALLREAVKMAAAAYDDAARADVLARRMFTEVEAVRIELDRIRRGANPPESPWPKLGYDFTRTPE